MLKEDQRWIGNSFIVCNYFFSGAHEGAASKIDLPAEELFMLIFIERIEKKIPVFKFRNLLDFSSLLKIVKKFDFL